MQWGAIGVVVFTVMIALAAKTRAFELVRDEEGKLRKDPSPAGKLLKAGFAVVLIGFFLLANYFGLASGSPMRFVEIFVHDLLVYLIILLYDTFVIDILVIVLWHPDFLHLPDTEGFTSTAFHLKTLIPGTLYGLIFSAIVAGLSYWLFF
jgi:hypothetical protein